MKLSAQVKLLASPEQAAALKKTLETANEACNYISALAWERQTFRQFPLHRLAYLDTRRRFQLTAQVVVRCIAKVANAYKVNDEKQCFFKPHGAIAYDERILSWKMDKSEVSIWTVEGRRHVQFVCGKRQRALLLGERGESDLCLVSGEFYLFVSCEIEEPEPVDIEGVLGVDLGIVQLATDSTGEMFSGQQVEATRKHLEHVRRTCQVKGTRSAKRKLMKLSGKQARFQKATNHTISKRIVQKAQDTASAIALENLKGIGQRATVKVRRAQRARHANWSFYQLRQFIDYKAQLAGVPVIFVDPRYTSRTCPVCGCVDKRNRPTQAKFSCISCGLSAPADIVAAVNIAARAAVSQPIVSDTRISVAPGTNPSPSGLGN